jgi:hypothetical protein
VRGFSWWGRRRHADPDETTELRQIDQWVEQMRTEPDPARPVIAPAGPDSRHTRPGRHRAELLDDATAPMTSEQLAEVLDLGARGALTRPYMEVPQ